MSAPLRSVEQRQGRQRFVQIVFAGHDRQGGNGGKGNGGTLGAKRDVQMKALAQARLRTGGCAGSDIDLSQDLKTLGSALLYVDERPKRSAPLHSPSFWRP